MISFVKGDLFQAPAQVLTNAVNCEGVMGAGIALRFKKQFPKMFADYAARCKIGELKIGKPYLYEDDSVQILNFPTKRDWRSPSQLADVEAGLKYLSEHYADMGIYSLAMPALGCGLGGLEWEEVKALISKYLSDLSDLEVVVFEPHSEAKAGPDKKGRQSDSKSNEDLAAQASLF